MVDPRYLCQKHLCGEHVECHMMAGCINKNMSMKGYISNGLIEIHNIQSRHNQLVIEMLNRGYNHKSPLPEFNSWIEGNINITTNINELKHRCPECKKRIEVICNP
jgi:hypothetical protein